MLKPLALGATALVLCFCVGPAGAAALASASMNIPSSVWYVDSDTFSDHSAADPPLTAVPSGSDHHSLRTYFDEQFVAQRYVQSSEDESVDGAVRASVGFEVAAKAKPTGAGSIGGASTEPNFWETEELGLRVDTSTTGGSDHRRIQNTIHSYSFDSGMPGMLSLVNGQVYEISGQASGRASETTPPSLPASVPSPPMLWLMAVGLFGVIACRKTFGLCN